MAPVPTAYFPSLDKCFSGDVQLLSWKRVFLYTNDAKGRVDTGSDITAFLEHPESIHLLSHCLTPFSRPSAKAKSEFESKTAAIHVETNSKNSFDLKEIKADAQWLSEKAQIDEIAALRIVVLEWQDRPAARLTDSFSIEETTSLQNAVGADNFRVSVAGPNLASIIRKAGTDEGAPPFDTEISRRLRLRSLYLSERCNLLKTARKLFTLSMHDLNYQSNDSSILAHRRKLASLGVDIFKDKISQDALGGYLEECIRAIHERLTALKEDGGWLGANQSTEQIDAIWRTTFVEEIVHILQIMFHQLHASNEIPSADLMLRWLELMEEYSFLEILQAPCEDPVEVLFPLQAFALLTTLAFMKLPLAVSSILSKTEPQTIPPGKTAYFLCKEKISSINEIFLKVCDDVTTAHPAAFSWGLLLRLMKQLASDDREIREMEQFHSAVNSFQSNTRNARSSGGPEKSLYEDLLDRARTFDYEAESAILILMSDLVQISALDAVVTLSTKSGSASAIDEEFTYRSVRMALLDFIRVAVMDLDYSPELVESVLAILTGNPTGFAFDSANLLGAASDPKSVFHQYELLMDKTFYIARSRFPYETVPFLRLCRALVCEHWINEDGLPQIIEELENMVTFTHSLPAGFQGYETTREDENANLVSLIESLPMSGSGAPKAPYEKEMHNALILRASSDIPAGTVGQVVSNAESVIVMWQHQYSCLSFLGSWLEEWSGSGGDASSQYAPCGIEIIELLADLVGSTNASSSTNHADANAKRVLEMASDGLSQQGDIISVVLDIFECNLQSVGSWGDPLRALEPIMACLRFIQEILKVLPCRVWPFLSRTSLIGSGENGGILTAIVSAVEIPGGDYSFLLSSISLFDAAVADAASRAVIRKSPGSASGKTTISPDWSAGIPSHVMRTIILNYTKTMVEIYNSNGNWRFDLPEQRYKINAILAGAFDRILYYAYGVNETAKLESKATGVFSDSATYILDMLRPQSQADLTFNPLIRLISDGLENMSTHHLRHLTVIERQVQSTLRLCARLVQAAQFAGQSTSLLEDQLFKATPVLVKLYAFHDAYRLPVASLLEILINSAASNPDHEPPSLVGHLGAESSCLFLDMLSQLDKPVGDKDLLLAIWKFLSTIVSKRQQWLSVFILTGSSPRHTLKKTNKPGDPSMRSVPFLQMALDKLAQIDQEEPQVALALLEFVSRAQENWPWATPQLKGHPQFFTSIVTYVSKLNISTLPVIDQIFVTRIAAVVADICAVYLHAAKEANDRSFFKTLIPLVQWYAKDAVEVSAYNYSLHRNLKKNFEMRYSGCQIIDFKRTSLVHRTLGPDYFYDIGLGQELLSYDFAWAGTRSQGFCEEFERANINLSLVEAQVSLLNSWKFFAMEHCADFMPDREIQRSMAVVAQNCLEANARSGPPEAIFERIKYVRVEFAQALLQRLVQAGAQGSEAFGLLEVTWKALRARHRTYEDALISDDIEYYRSLLNVLFLSLQFHLVESRSSPAGRSKVAQSSDMDIIVEVVKVVVAQGFKSLTTYLHEQPEKCTPKDFAIIIAILQTCLQVKDIDRLLEHINYHVQDNDIARHATTLFSWADQLDVAGDPVYGDLSLSILVKLSTLPPLAEHLAVEAVLMKISTCRLTNILRQPRGFGPFDPVPRFYLIWTGGILPLCLNLLYNVTRAAAEVGAFLNQFEGQLNCAAKAFSLSQQWISLSMASEAYSLALISFILERCRVAGASAGLDTHSIQALQWDKAQVKDDIEELLQGRATLRTRIAPTNEKEMEWSRQKAVDTHSGAENRLEEKVVKELQAAVACLVVEEDS